MSRKALLFSGQGSQYVGMLKDVHDNFKLAKKMIKKAKDVLGFDIKKICFEGPEEVLKETRYTQPAIFLHSAINYDLTKENLEYIAVAGHSVGEYAALYAAGVLEFEDALKLVAKRGELMFKAGEELPGTMFAVIKLADSKVIDVCEDLTAKGNGNVVVAANFNSPGQVVVSGSRDYLRAHAVKFKEAGARMVKELVVSGAFHSPLLNSAQEELEEAINSTKFKDAEVDVYSNVTATPIRNADEIKEALIKQLTSPVLWTQTLRAMQDKYINDFIEIGPSSVLQSLVKRTIFDAEASGIDTAEEINQILNK
jgi:[acyl-carrier-protein] S-malonyltransferase